MNRILSLIAALFLSVAIFAQVDEVTLTTIGTGRTEDEATHMALRNAIEQTFGTFVSANTAILNDEIVKEEIVNISSGNIKEFQKLAVSSLPNGHISVSLKATVSVNRLISYTQGKGAAVEFAGQTFAANVKLMKLKAASADKAYATMVEQLELLANKMFDFDFSVNNNPYKIGTYFLFDAYVVIYANSYSHHFQEVLQSTQGALALSPQEKTAFERIGIPTSNINSRFVRGQYETTYDWTLPLPQERLDVLNDRIHLAVQKARHRYAICEINNASECFQWECSVINKEKLYDRYHADMAILELKKDGLPCSVINWTSTTEEHRQYQKGNRIWIPYRYNMDYNLFKLTPFYRPIDTGNKKIKRFHNVQQTVRDEEGQTRIDISHFTLWVDEDKIEQLTGFKIIGASTPTKPLKRSSQANKHW